MTHEYKSVTYCTQRLREFLDSYMFDKYGHKFPNLKNHDNYVSFDYVGEKFAVRLEVIDKNCKKIKTSLEIKTGDSWQELKKNVFDIKRSKIGKISDKTYIPLFENFLILGIKEYASKKD